MYKIELKRNDKCLCGSNLKFKKCCGKKGNIEYFEITDIDFILINDFNKSVPYKNKSNIYHETFKAFKELENVCIEYKEKVFKKSNIKSNENILYKYVFKKISVNDENTLNELYLCGLKELGDSKKINIETVKENINSSFIILESLKKVIIPDKLYERQDEINLEKLLKENNINIIYKE